MALAAIAAGEHVYCERPLAVTAEDAEAIQAAAAKRGVKTMVAFNNVKAPAALLARDLIAAGEIGRPIRFRGWFDQGFFSDPSLACPALVLALLAPTPAQALLAISAPMSFRSPSS